ncbi:DUF4126 domain-containing protein [Labrys okinawensis]|uniref:DUF4126 domain-containing protein n=1 Tax=Labrys okinawensis TaxID=346911 RepID=A0A2S9QDL7_9HYPH|nr:DUF4126 family protein [Labrys okinawensis]PRH87436.1 DUF4126 domain-containing protein [Labrys okinawensis]
MSLLGAFLIGVVAGLRTFTAPAAVSWAAYLGWLPLDGTPLAFLGHPITPYVFTILALLEFVGDQLPSTPSRKVPMQFGARLLSGAFSGAAIGFAGGSWLVGLIGGVAGAIVGTLGGHEVRRRLALAFGRDLPAALIEDAVAVLGAFLIVKGLL